MITIFFNDNFNNLTLKNLAYDFEKCYQLFLEVMKYTDNSFGISVHEKTLQFYKENEDRILVEIINTNLVNHQMFANFEQSVDIIKEIYQKNAIEVLSPMRLVDIRRESLDDVLNKI
ncbi:hypothetical protein [Chryseobacterium sp. JUb7]|uniref:hypothetical protein n=1 Tax=Chryseobacterium sp. JUb7 TaxID=2940599 RepID=UPI00216A2A03|nr:hypothetical protein [Chryseobacterium sp. JUb7]MCS3529757.1 hypothetical protein [Chryseobacterium sp. JUb7]